MTNAEMPTFVDLNDLETLSLHHRKNAFLQENGLNSKLQQIKAQNSILSRGSGDPYGILGYWETGAIPGRVGVYDNAVTVIAPETGRLGHV